MHPLNIYGYRVRYGASERKQKDYCINESVCFSPLFSSQCKAKYYRIFILKGDADLKKYHSNYCFFDKKQIINHLKQIPKFCMIKFSVKETVYKGDDAFQIDMYIDSANRTVHKYVLTWVRTLFEWPFYLYLIHAKELHKMPEFRFESIINLFNVIASVYHKSYSTNIHTFGTFLLPSKKKEIINKVKKVSRVNNIFNRNSGLEIPEKKLPNNFEQITAQLFEENVPAYIEAYHIFKKEYENNNNRK